MIASFRHKGLQAFFETGSTKGIQAKHTQKLTRILLALDTAVAPAELDLPGYRLHALKGKRKGFWSVWVNGNWRIIFRFDGVDAELVDYLDYH